MAGLHDVIRHPGAYCLVMWPHLVTTEAVNLVSVWAAKSLRKEGPVVKRRGREWTLGEASRPDQASVLASLPPAASGPSPCIWGRDSAQLQTCSLPAW